MQKNYMPELSHIHPPRRLGRLLRGGTELTGGVPCCAKMPHMFDFASCFSRNFEKFRTLPDRAIKSFMRH